MSTYDDALRFLEGLDVSAMKLGLSRVRRLLETLGNPQDQLPMVHVAGTNGKGSVTAMLATILKTAGNAVGTFTSPHLVHVRERIAINGNPILPDDFQFEVVALKDHLETLEWPADDWPTYFEFLNVMAYRYFKRKGVDVTVFETGLGGRLDSTNVVRHPNLTVITGIGLDHIAHLGDTMAQIASEKAGILKAGTPLVMGPSVPSEAAAVILRQAEGLDIPVIVADAESLVVDEASSPVSGLQVRNRRTGQVYRLSLLGPYQKNNLATVLACVQQLRQQGFDISEEAVETGLDHVHWPVRFQYFPREAVLLDGSHNAEGFASLAEGLQLYFKSRPMIWLLSLRANRSPQALLELIRQWGTPLGIVVTRAQPEPLYHAPADLAAQVRDCLGAACPVEITENPTDALARLRAMMAHHAADSPLGVVTGSLYTAGEILHCLERAVPVPEAQV